MFKKFTHTINILASSSFMFRTLKRG